LGAGILAVALLLSNGAQARWDTERRQDLAAETLEGGTGLFHLRSVTYGPRFELRVGLSWEYFHHKQFIVQDWPGCDWDCTDERNERMRGAVTFGATLWRHVEIFGAVYFSRNTNYRNHFEPTEEPEDQIIAGDFAVGLKFFFPVDRLKALVMGGLMSVRAHTGLGDIHHRADATTVHIAYLLSFRADRINRYVPFRLHFNFGFVADPSHRVLGDYPEDWTPSDQESMEVHHRFLVQQFALNLNTSRVSIGLGFEFPIRSLGGLVDPILELQMDIHTGGPNPVILSWHENELSGNDFRDRSPVASRLVTGLRIRPVAGLVLDVGIGLRALKPGSAFGLPLPPWNLFLKLGYVLPVGKAIRRAPRKTPPPYHREDPW
jgi:hypothetical protein